MSAEGLATTNVVAPQSGTFAWFMSHIDGNWIDGTSLVVAVIFMTYKWKCALKSTAPYKLISKRAGQNLANGTAFFPLLILGLSIFSTTLMGELMKANKLILSVAGFCALFALLEDDE